LYGSIAPEQCQPRSLLDLAKPTMRYATLTKARTSFEEEAAFEVLRAAGQLTREAEEELRQAGKGVPMTSPFYATRYTLAVEYLNTGNTSSEAVALIWGPTVTRGRLLRQQAAQLLLGPLKGRQNAGEVVRAWAAAAGAPGFALSALDKLVANFMDRAKNALPEVMDAPGISEAAFHLAVRLAGDDALLALNLCQCFARIAAVTFAEGTLIRWRFSWLRGKRQSDDAIPGTSGRYKALMAILTAHVLDEVEGAVRRRKSRTYRLRVSIGRGPVTIKEAALKLGLTARRAMQE
jgi:hypothetical protein